MTFQNFKKKSVLKKKLSEILNLQNLIFILMICEAS